MIRRLLIVAGVVLALAASVRLLAVTLPGRIPVEMPALPADPAGPPEKVDGKPRWRALWSAPTPGLTALSLASDGSGVAWSDAAGRVRRIDAETGKTVWQSPPLGEGLRLLGAPGGAVLAWVPYNPGRRRLHILDPATGADRPLIAAAPLWCVAADADTLWVGTGDRVLTAYPRAGGAPRPIVLHGIPESVTASGGVALVGLWLDSGAAAVQRDGALLWEVRDEEPARRYTPLLNVTGTTAVLFSAIGPDRKSPQLTVFDARSGARRWEVPADGDDLRYALSADGARLAVSSARREMHKLTVYDYDGEPLIGQRGSRFFDPRLVTISAQGERITVRDGERGMTCLDARGRTLSRRLTLPVDKATGKPVSFRQTLATPDGRYLLVQRGDGQLTFFAAVE